jgi:hypothetical protein
MVSRHAWQWSPRAPDSKAAARPTVRKRKRRPKVRLAQPCHAAGERPARPGEIEELVRKGIELAKAGDPQMLKFFLDRFLPKDRLVKIDLPSIESRRDLIAALAAVVQAVKAGQVAPSEGSAVAALLASIARFIDDAEVEARLRSLEEQLNYLREKS